MESDCLCVVSLVCLGVSEQIGVIFLSSIISDTWIRKKNTQARYKDCHLRLRLMTDVCNLWSLQSMLGASSIVYYPSSTKYFPNRIHGLFLKTAL